jgi:hypothetical protein
MKKIYYIGPLVAFAAFVAYTMHFNTEYEAHEAQVALEAKTIREAKLKVEADARKKAIDDAMVSQARLKKERTDKEAEELRKKDARLLAIETRDRNYREQEKLGRQIERIKKDVKLEQEALAKLDGSIKFNNAEKAFHSQFIEKARQNITYLTDLLTKIESVEVARSSAAATTPKIES